MRHLLKKTALNLLLAQRRNYHEARHLVLFGGEGMRSFALSLSNSVALGNRTLTCVSGDSWLKKIHPDWYNLRWGQSARYLPTAMRACFEKKFPLFPTNEKMTFEQVKVVIDSLEEELISSPNINFINADVSQLLQDQEGLKLIERTGNIQQVCKDLNFHVINSAKSAKSDFGKGIKLSPFSDIYSISKSDIAAKELIVLIGSGLNTQWAFRDLKIPMIYLIPAGDRVIPEIVRDKNCKCAMKMDDVNFSIVPGSDNLVHIQGVDLKTSKEMNFYVDQANLFTAQGTSLNKDIIRVEPTKVNHIDTAAKPRDLSIAHQLSFGKKFIKPEDMRGTTVPNGNLAHVYFSILGEMNLLAQFPIDSPYAALHYFKGWKKAVKERIHDLGVEVNPEFFHQLYINFKHVNTSDVQSEENLWTVMALTYKKAHTRHSYHDEHGHLNHFFKHDSSKKILSWDDFRNMLCATFVKSETNLKEPKPTPPKFKKH